nr:RNA-directed DNA polymerase, eukaryota [Tanacetum cinerariifolium]
MALVKSCDPIIDKFSRCLSKWKASLLSIGGRFTLITSVLGAIGTYYFSLFSMPSTVHKKLETIRSKFFWGGDETSNKIPWIAWNLALAVKDKGGLAIGSLYSLNHALIQKYGSSTKFWHDTWIGTTSFQNQFPRLYRLAPIKDIMVRNCWNHSWNFTWSHNISSGTNASQLASLHNLLSETSLNDSKDIWAWQIESPVFTVKSARKHIDNYYLPDGNFATRWNRYLPKKINIFFWRALQDRLPTRWNLSRKGIDIASISCPVCDGLYGWLDALHTTSNKKDILEVICGVVLWSLWIFRNETVFGTNSPKRCLLFDKIVDCSFR